MTKTAFIYPGQGAQYTGMGKDFYEAFPAVRRRFEEASELLKLDMAKLCFSEKKKLDRTEFTQPAMVLTELALTEVLRQERGVRADVSAGLSLGEYAAISEAGALSFSDALITVAERGKLMAGAVPQGQGAMAAVLGAELSLIEEITAGIEGVYIANYNCPGQTVITGKKTAVEKAAEALSKAGVKKTVMLNVSGPFHSPLLLEAGEKLSAVLSGIELRLLEHPYLANVTAEYVRNESEIKNLLCRQVAASVRWQQSVERMLSDGVETFIEIGPGKTLSGFMKKILKEYGAKTGADLSRVRTLRVETPEDLSEVQGC